MTTTTDLLSANERDMDVRTTLRQIGSGNFLATSGGVYRTVCDGLELPVSSGYAVRITLAANDTYTVQRIFRRAGRVWVKGERTQVHADELGETVYQAGCYRNVEL